MILFDLTMTIWQNVWKNLKSLLASSGYIWYCTKTLERYWVEEHKLHKAVCEICGSQERCKIMRHNKTSKRECHHCGKYLSDPTKLNVHLWSVHRENTFIYKCHYCQKEYPKLVTLKSHINAKHEQTTRYQRSECPLGIQDVW